MADEKKPDDGVETKTGEEQATTPESELTPDNVAGTVVVDEEPAPVKPEEDEQAAAQAEEAATETPAETVEGEVPPAEEPETPAVDGAELAEAASVAETDEEKPAEPEPDEPVAETPSEPEPTPAPVVRETVVERVERKGGFVPMVLGGVIAAALGWGVSGYMNGTLPFLPSSADSFETETTAALGAQASQIEALSGKIDETAGKVAGLDTSGLDSAVSDLGSKLDAVQGDLATLGDKLSDLDQRLDAMEKRPVAEAVSPEAIAAYERELEDVRAAIQAQRAEVEQMTRDALASEASAAEQSALAQSRAALGLITSALQSGDPYTTPLATLTDNGVSLPDGLGAPAADGVATLAELNESFPPLAREALSAARRAEAQTEDTAGRLTTFLANQLGARSVTPRDGTSPDAVLSRAEAALKAGDLATTLSELETLPEEARAPLSGWIASAQTRLSATQAAAAVAQELNKE